MSSPSCLPHTMPLDKPLGTMTSPSEGPIHSESGPGWAGLWGNRSLVAPPEPMLRRGVEWGAHGSPIFAQGRSGPQLGSASVPFTHALLPLLL